MYMSFCLFCTTHMAHEHSSRWQWTQNAFTFYRVNHIASFNFVFPHIFYRIVEVNKKKNGKELMRQGNSYNFTQSFFFAHVRFKFFTLSELNSHTYTKIAVYKRSQLSCYSIYDIVNNFIVDITVNDDLNQIDNIDILRSMMPHKQSIQICWYEQLALD